MPTPLNIVQQDYATIQFDPPPPLNQAFVNAYLLLDPAVVISSIEAEAYTQNVVNPVIREYQASFNRVPDQGGESYWVQQFGQGFVPLSKISQVFANSTEFSTTHGGATANSTITKANVDLFYLDGLNRAADPGGEAYWVGTGLPTWQVLQYFSQSPEAIATTNSYVIQYENLQAALTPPVPPTTLFAVTPPAPTYNLTPGVDVVPPTGALPANAVVNGIAGATSAASTYQSWDTITGTAGAHDVFNIRQISNITAANAIAASVSNLEAINHIANGPVGSTARFNEAGYSGIVGENIVAGSTGGTTTLLTNASPTTIFSISSTTTDGFNLGFGTATGVTVNFQALGAGVVPIPPDLPFLIGNSPQASVETFSTSVAKVALTTLGLNDVRLNGIGSVTEVDITGAGNNIVTLGSAIAASGVTVDASAATGNNRIDFGTFFSLSDIVKGSTTAGALTTVGLVIAGASATVPTWTNVQTVQVDSGSTGSLNVAALTSISTILDLDQTGGVATFANLPHLSSLVFDGQEISAGTNVTFGGITLAGASLPGHDSVAVTFVNEGVARGSADAATVGALTLNGAGAISINTAHIVGGTGNFTLGGGLFDSNLTSLTLTDASTGVFNANSIDDGANNTLATFDASAVAGDLSVTFAADVFAGGATVTGSVGANTIIFGADAHSQRNINVVLSNGAENVSLAGISKSNYAITAGNGDSTIDLSAGTGTGTDHITVGNGNDTIKLSTSASTVSVGTGTDAVDLNAGHTLGADPVSFAINGTLATNSAHFTSVTNTGAGDLFIAQNGTQGAGAATFNGAGTISTLLTAVKGLAAGVYYDTAAGHPDVIVNHVATGSLAQDTVFAVDHFAGAPTVSILGVTEHITLV